MADEDTEPSGDDAPEPEERSSPRQRLRGLVRVRPSRAQAVIALACLVLGFGVSVQVHSTSSQSSFDSLRQSELVSLLDRLTQKQDDLRAEKQRLRKEKAALRHEDSSAARHAAKKREETLGILAGTKPATGPGIELLITDPDRAVRAADILNTVQELRDAGAEAVQIGSVRVAADSYFLDAEGGIVVDGHKLAPPYRILAIGDSHTMSTALDIPGGVLESLRRAGAEGSVTETASVSVTAVRKP